MRATLLPIAALACGFTAVMVAGQSAADQNTTTEVLRFSGPGPRTLDLRAITGSISVSGSDSDEVELVAQKTVTAKSDDDRLAAEREVVLETLDNASTIEVTVREMGHPICGEEWREEDHAWPRRRLRYQVRFDFMLRVPRGTRLQLCTINKGDVRVEGTAGDFDVKSVNGRIVMKDIRGSGRAVTVNGPVNVTFVEAPKDASLFKTVNGDVDVTFPSGLSADLRMKTLNGGLFTDFDVQPVAVRAVAKPDRRNGMFVYHTNDFTTVRVGQGGPELTFDAFNGDVRARSNDITRTR